MHSKKLNHAHSVFHLAELNLRHAITINTQNNWTFKEYIDASIGSSIVTMPSAKWCAVDVHNFLQLIENMTPTDCYAIKWIKQQSLPCFHSSPTQLSLFTAYLKKKCISISLFTQLSHTSSKCMPNRVAAPVVKRKGLLWGKVVKEWLCAGALQNVLGCAGTVGLAPGAFQNLCCIAVWYALDLHLLPLISHFLTSCHQLSQSISVFSVGCTEQTLL